MPRVVRMPRRITMRVNGWIARAASDTNRGQAPRACHAPVPAIPALPGPNGGDHLARCRIDHGAAVDYHGRDRLVTAGHRANESGRIGIPPDVDLPDGKMMPPQGKTQPPAEHTARPPVQGDPGR